MILEFSLGRLGGYTLCMCASGNEALDKAAVFAPHLVLLDVMMPGMSGPETLHHLRELDFMRGVPIVFLTAKAMQDELEVLLQHGATGIIVKPFDPVTLPKRISVFIGSMDVAYTPEGLDPAFAEQFAQIRQTFILGLAKRESEIEHAPTRANLNLTLHRLAGAAGAYGFEELSQLARSVMEASHHDDEVHLLKVMAELKQTLKTIRGTG